MSTKRNSPKTPSTPKPEPRPLSEAERSALLEVVSPSEMEAIERAGGYAAIIADTKTCRSFEDILEPLSTQRAVNVRNALRELGWDTLEGESDHAPLHKGGLTFEAAFEKGPSGFNVVYYSAKVKEDFKLKVIFLDRLEMSTLAFAQKIDDAAHGRPTSAEEPSALGEPAATPGLLASDQGAIASNPDAASAAASLLAGPEAYQRMSPIIQAAVTDAMEQLKGHFHNHNEDAEFSIQECSRSYDGFMATQDGGWIGNASFFVEDLESTKIPLPAEILFKAQEYVAHAGEGEDTEDAMSTNVTFEVTAMVFSPDNYRNTHKNTGQWEVLCFSQVKYGETYMVTNQPERTHVNGPDISIAVNPADDPSVLRLRLTDAFTKAVAFLANEHVLPLRERMTLEDRLASGQLIELTPGAHDVAKKAQETLKSFRVVIQKAIDDCHKDHGPEVTNITGPGGLLDFNIFNEAAEALRAGLEQRELSGAVPQIPALMEHLNILGEPLGLSYTAHTIGEPHNTPFTEQLSRERVQQIRDLLDAVRFGIHGSAVSDVVTNGFAPNSVPGASVRQTVTANHETRCYIINHGSHVSTLGFDYARNRANAVAAWLKQEALKVPSELDGTADAYHAYAEAMDAGARHHALTGQRCNVELSKQLIGLEHKRVEVEDNNGEKRRFWVGKSTGWMPCHLEVHNRRSSGGPAADRDYKSVRVIDDGPR